MPKWAYESQHNQLCQRVDEPNSSRYGRNGFTFQHFALEEYGLNLVPKYEVPPHLPERLGKTVSIQILELSFQIVIGLSVSPARNENFIGGCDPGAHPPGSTLPPAPQAQLLPKLPKRNWR